MQRQRPVADEHPQALHELRRRLSAEVCSRTEPDGDVLRGSLAVPHHQHERYFFELSPSDLVLHALVGVVDVNPEIKVVQPLRDFPRVFHVPVSDWMTRAWTGESQTGNAPAKCSMRKPTKRSWE